MKITRVEVVVSLLAIGVGPAACARFSRSMSPEYQIAAQVALYAIDRLETRVLLHQLDQPTSQTVQISIRRMQEALSLAASREKTLGDSAVHKALGELADRLTVAGAAAIGAATEPTSSGWRQSLGDPSLRASRAQVLTLLHDRAVPRASMPVLSFTPVVLRGERFRDGDRRVVAAARFARYGSVVMCAAAKAGEPPEVLLSFRSLLDVLEPSDTAAGDVESSESGTRAPIDVRSCGIPNANLLATEALWEMAVLTDLRAHKESRWIGTLGQVPLLCGPPRQILTDVEYADFTPDGSGLAVVHHIGQRAQLESPIGRVLLETTGDEWISHPRISPNGDLIAFLQHPDSSGDGGTVEVVDLKGQRTRISRGWASISGLAWSRDEIWVSGTKAGNEQGLYAVGLSGTERRVAETEGSVTLHDIAPDGRVLLWVGESAHDTSVSSPGRTSQYSWPSSAGLYVVRGWRSF